MSKRDDVGVGWAWGTRGSWLKGGTVEVRHGGCRRMCSTDGVGIVVVLGVGRGCQYHRLRIVWTQHLLDVDRYEVLGG